MQEADAVLVALARTQENIKAITQTFVQSQRETKQDSRDIKKQISEMVKAITSLTSTSERYFLQQTHLGDTLQDLRKEFHEFKHQDFHGLSETVHDHEKILAGNKVRWVVVTSVAGTVLALLTSGALWLIDSAMSPIMENTTTQQEVHEQQVILNRGVETIIRELQEETK